MVASNILHYGIRHDGGSYFDSIVLYRIHGDYVLSALYGGLSMVVEVVFQLCLRRVLSVFIFALVPCDQVGFGRDIAFHGIFVLHGDHLLHICIVLWRSRTYIILLVLSKDLWLC